MRWRARPAGAGPAPRRIAPNARMDSSVPILMTQKKRILTGDRPTGRLHLGHFVGSLVNRVRLQEEYETILIIADLHTLTTKNSRQDIEKICENSRGMVLDY